MADRDGQVAYARLAGCDRIRLGAGPCAACVHEGPATELVLFHGGQEVGLLCLARPPFELFREPGQPEARVVEALGALISARRSGVWREPVPATNSSPLEAPDLLVELDHDGRFLAFHTVDESMLFLPPRDFLGRRFHEVMPASVVEIVACAIREVDTLGGSHRYAYALPMAGGERWFELVASRRGGDEPPEGGGYLMHVRDVTAYKRLAADRERLSAQLERARRLESIGRLAGGVAHDFNNVLGVILGHAELALSALPAGSPVLADLEAIRLGAQQSAAITRQLLSFSRRQSATNPIIDLVEAVEPVVELLRRMLGPGVELWWSPSSDRAHVTIDPGELTQVLMNLCVNARDAVGGAGVVRLSTRLVTLDAPPSAHPGRAPGPYAVLSVEDDGCGMDEVVKAHLFEPFFTTKPPGVGSGLGLATVYGAVLRSGGFVEVESEVGVGTAVRVHLPAHGVPASPARGPREAPSRVNAPNASLWIVEDNPSILRMLTRALQAAGYTVRGFGGPSEALAASAIDLAGVDLLLSDVVMPGLSGPELVERLRARRPDLRALLMSGYVGRAGVAEGVPPEGEVLAKPFSLQALVARVEQSLRSAP